MKDKYSWAGLFVSEIVHNLPTASQLEEWLKVAVQIVLLLTIIGNYLRTKPKHKKNHSEDGDVNA